MFRFHNFLIAVAGAGAGAGAVAVAGAGANGSGIQVRIYFFHIGTFLIFCSASGVVGIISITSVRIISGMVTENLQFSGFFTPSSAIPKP